MTRIILYGAIAILVLFAFKFFKLMSNYKSGSRPNVDDLKERAANLKNKYKNVQEADFRDITSSEDETESPKK
ncbi:MAG: hypothetical protein HND39_10030 [Ignavibacteriota bacterium]|jgi:hypothetical protein|nr:MAG: hypothetical protein EDM72_02625 [Chlorobiota bacterium]MBE7476615.1 hypothetical protein [Ignavibacteriales bacterium]MBL1123755.1 hypothetical protein [Ignavibacteriota bacterium]MCC7095348.1 hypothetical protein [Ignavibacteriaceae bacterium]MCE7855642.1 hypothetical protein [Ignavibacteria bacterium CHB3]MEB2296992.1 hypothetical protein [Ignavibacteria bacterium]